MVLLLALTWSWTVSVSAAPEPPRFEIDIATAAIEGTGIGSTSSFERRIEDVNDGRGRSFAFRWRPLEDWSAEVRYEQQTLAYEDPQNVFCPMSAGVLTGYELCRAATYPRVGQVEDVLKSLTVLVSRTWRPLDGVSIGATLGLGSARWRSSGDTESSTFSTCLRGPPPSPIPDCTPISDEATETGWVFEASVGWAATDWLRVVVGGHWQERSYRPYRNEAGPRFCSVNTVSEFGGFCNSLDAFLPKSAFDDRSWSWWYGEAAWNVTDAWELALRGEAAGSRDWETVSVALRYRW
jgi:hypothetical protein